MTPESFPPQIQSLSALYPTGNLAAEVVACVDAIARKRRRARLKAAAVALAAIFAVVGVGAAVWRGRNPEPGLFSLSSRSRILARRSPAWPPWSRCAATPRILCLISTASSAWRSSWRALRRSPSATSHRSSSTQTAARTSSNGSGSPPKGDSLVTPRRWRACIRHAGVRGQTCGDWSEWDAGPLVGAAPLAEAQRGRSRVVASTAAGFLIGLASPHQLLVQSSGGDSARVVPLPGEPTAIAVAGDRVAVGTRAPGVIVVLGPGGQRSEHQVPTGRVGGSEASTGVASVALTEREAWVITGGPDGDPAIRLLDFAAGRWVTLPYAGNASSSMRAGCASAPDPRGSGRCRRRQRPPPFIS